MSENTNSYKTIYVGIMLFLGVCVFGGGGGVVNVIWLSLPCVRVPDIFTSVVSWVGLSLWITLPVLKEQQINGTTVSFGFVECLLKGSYCVITTPHIGTGPGNHKWLYSKQQSIISKYSAVIDLHSNRRRIYHV